MGWLMLLLWQKAGLFDAAYTNKLAALLLFLNPRKK